MPILLNPDGSKMSKRHGDVRVEDFIVGALVLFSINYHSRLKTRNVAGSLTPF